MIPQNEDEWLAQWRGRHPILNVVWTVTALLLFGWALLY